MSERSPPAQSARARGAEDEYVEELLETLYALDVELPAVVLAGTQTVLQKTGVDMLDLVRARQEELAEARVELLALDDEYEQELARARPCAPPASDNLARAADFAAGVVLSLQRDFSQAPDLMHAMQQIYLFRKANDCP